MTLDVDDCLRISCKGKPASNGKAPTKPDQSSEFYGADKRNKNNSIDPGSFYICNRKKNQTLNDALCFPNTANPDRWFENSDLQTFVAEYIGFEKFLQTDLECPSRPELSPRSSDQYCYKNSSCCLTKDTEKLFGKTRCRMDFHCVNTTMYRTETKASVRWGRIAIWTLIPILFLLGSLAVIGNVAVIINSTSVLRHSTIQSKEIIGYNILLLSLGSADLLMGIYMVGASSIGFKYVVTTIGEWRKASESDHIEMSLWISNGLCSAFGGISFLSSQISVTVLVAITGLRLYGVCFPYRPINLKVIKTIVFTSWIFWAFVCYLPVLNVEPVKTLFVDAIQFTRNNKLTTLRYFHIRFVLRKFLGDINKYCNFTKNQGFVLQGRFYWKTLLTVAKKLKLLDPTELKDLQFLSYYSMYRGCAPRFLVHHFNKFFYYSLSILTFNTTSFAFIFLGQLIIAKKTFETASDSHKRNCSSLRSLIKYLKSSKNPLRKQRETENQQMRKRMFLIVLTDFLCWIPVSFISIYYNVQTSKQDLCTFLPYRENMEKWFYIFVTIMLPLNSVINPFIYSYSTRRRIKSIFSSCCFVFEKREKRPTSNASGSPCTVSSAA